MRLGLSITRKEGTGKKRQERSTRREGPGKKDQVRRTMKGGVGNAEHPISATSSASVPVSLSVSKFPRGLF